MTIEAAPVLDVADLVIRYPGAPRHSEPVVRGVSLRIQAGETLALVGESGSGKSTIGRAVLGLTPVLSGTVILDGVDVTRGRRFTRTSRIIQAVFQDPYSSLNPRRTIGDSLRAAIPDRPRKVADREIATVLARVGLPSDAADRYPAMFSGGQRQRIAIARAVLPRPKVIVCDEPTSALDVSTQAAALDLLADLQRELGTAYLFITHDLAVVRSFADRVAVLNAGRVVETGTAAQVCTSPSDPYTQRLVMSAPVPDPRIQRERRAARLEFAAREAAAAPSGSMGRPT